MEYLFLGSNIHAFQSCVGTICIEKNLCHIRSSNLEETTGLSSSLSLALLGPWVNISAARFYWCLFWFDWQSRVWGIFSKMLQFHQEYMWHFWTSLATYGTKRVKYLIANGGLMPIFLITGDAHERCRDEWHWWDLFLIPCLPSPVTMSCAAVCQKSTVG